MAAILFAIANPLLIIIYQYHVINKMVMLFKKNRQWLLIKTNLGICCFVASEFCTIEYNTMDKVNARVSGQGLR